MAALVLARRVRTAALAIRRAMRHADGMVPSNSIILRSAMRSYVAHFICRPYFLSPIAKATVADHTTTRSYLVSDHARLFASALFHRAMIYYRFGVFLRFRADVLSPFLALSDSVQMCVVHYGRSSDYGSGYVVLNSRSRESFNHALT